MIFKFSIYYFFFFNFFFFCILKFQKYCDKNDFKFKSDWKDMGTGVN